LAVWGFANLCVKQYVFILDGRQGALSKVTSVWVTTAGREIGQTSFSSLSPDRNCIIES